MNDAASAPGASLIPETTDLFTGGAFALIAVLAALTIAGILYGMHRARCRRKAERELEAHNERVEEQASEVVDVPVSLSSSGERVAEPKARSGEGQSEPPSTAPVPPSLRSGTPSPEEEREAVARPASDGPSPADGPVTQLKGLGPKVAATLAGHGITTVGQLAALTDDEAYALDARMGPFTGRMGRDRWQEQARFLAAGDRAGFEAVFGRLYNKS